MPDTSDSQLIEDAQRGNTESIGELFRRHHSVSINIARRFLPLGDESADAVQSAYVAALRNFTSFRGDSSFKTWITRIVINECLMQVRRSARSRRFLSLDHSVSGSAPIVVRDTAPTPEQLTQTAELRRMLLETAATLPLPLREAFHLCAISGLSVAETAAALRISFGAAKTRVFRARLMMQSKLKHLRAPKEKTAPGTVICRSSAMGGSRAISTAKCILRHGAYKEAA